MRRRIPTGLELEHLQQHVSEVLDMLASLDAASAGWTPAVDILALPELFVVRIDLPGVRPADLAVSLRGSELRVTGCKQPTTSIASPCRYLAVERGFGHFELEIPLPGPVQCKATAASLHRGVLEIRLPRLDDRRSTVFSVPVSEEAT